MMGHLDIYYIPNINEKGASTEGVGTAGATGTLAPRNAETAGAKVSFPPHSQEPHPAQPFGLRASVLRLASPPQC